MPTASTQRVWNVSITVASVPPGAGTVSGAGILRMGGTILGTVNRGNPLHESVETSDGTCRYDERCVEICRRLDFDAIIDLVVHRLPDLPKRILESAVCGVTAALCGFIAWHSALFVREESRYGAVLFGDVPAWPFQLAIPLGFALIAWRYALYTTARGPRRAAASAIEGQTH